MLYLVLLFPVNGLFIIYLWALTLCNFIQGYIVIKEKKYLIGAAVLCFINAFYVPTVLHYSFFEYMNFNMPFWIANLFVATAVSVPSRINKRRIGPKKWIPLYVLCNIFGCWGMTSNGEFLIGGILYVAFAVVVFPVSYYFYAKGKYSHTDDAGNQETSSDDENTHNGE